MVEVPTFQPVRPVRLYERIVAQIVVLLASGGLQPGDRLPIERDLVVPFGPSRSTERQALPVLEPNGVVRPPPRRRPEATVGHDSETILGSAGVGPRLFDPATKSRVRIDSSGNVIDEGWTR